MDWKAIIVYLTDIIENTGLKVSFHIAGCKQVFLCPVKLMFIAACAYLHALVNYAFQTVNNDYLNILNFIFFVFRLANFFRYISYAASNGR